MYTFVWKWQFNNQNDVYATCFDVLVTSSKAERDATLTVSDCRIKKKLDLKLTLVLKIVFSTLDSFDLVFIT